MKWFKEHPVFLMRPGNSEAFPFLPPTSGELGFSLVSVLFLMAVISGILLILFQLYLIERKVIRQNIDYISVKNSAESALAVSVSELSHSSLGSLEPLAIRHFPGDDTISGVSKNILIFGTYLVLDIVAKKHRQSFGLQAVLGQQLFGKFQAAVVTNPLHGGLILAEGSRINGPVYTGTPGIRRGSLHGSHKSISKSTNETVYISGIDQRPAIQRSLINGLFQNFDNFLQEKNILTFPVDGYSPIDRLRLRSTGNFPVFAVSSRAFSHTDLKLSGPAVFVIKDSCLVISAGQIGPWAVIIADKEIIIKGSPEIINSIFYSRQRISIIGCQSLQAQLFSRKAILIEEETTFEYPTVLMILAQADSGSINISGESELNGSAFYLVNPDTSLQSVPRGIIRMSEGSTVNGLLYSDQDLSLNGEVNGIVITDRFYLYRSPMVFTNWLFDIVINRNQLTDEFTLPLVFSTGRFQLKPADIR